MRQCVFVIGTRAQLVKVAPVLRRAIADRLPHVVWLTGQHQESMEDLIDDFGIESTFVHPDSESEKSNVRRLIGWLPFATYRCIRYLRELRDETALAPLVIVHGDTASTVLGAIAGRLTGSPVVHLESGLTSGTLFDPFPEELSRRIASRLARYALCPNDAAFAFMQKRGNCEAVHTGENSLLDCVRYAMQSTADSRVSDYFVASIHRFGNIYRRPTLQGIVDELCAIAESGTVHFVLHPATRRRLEHYHMLDKLSRIPRMELVPRMSYRKFIGLIGGARGVFTDGGSNQEELSYLGVPTVLYRQRSERPDGLGGNVVLRADVESPLPEFVRSGELDSLRRRMRTLDHVQPSATIVDALTAWAKQ